jgi:hypothetical protein
VLALPVIYFYEYEQTNYKSNSVISLSHINFFLFSFKYTRFSVLDLGLSCFFVVKDGSSFLFGKDGSGFLFSKDGSGLFNGRYKSVSLTGNGGSVFETSVR